MQQLHFNVPFTSVDIYRKKKLIITVFFFASSLLLNCWEMFRFRVIKNESTRIILNLSLNWSRIFWIQMHLINKIVFIVGACAIYRQQIEIVVVDIHHKLAASTSQSPKLQIITCQLFFSWDYLKYVKYFFNTDSWQVI